MTSCFDYLKEENKVSFDYQMRKTGMGNMDHLNMSSDLSEHIILTKTPG